MTRFSSLLNDALWPRLWLPVTTAHAGENGSTTMILSCVDGEAGLQDLLLPAGGDVVAQRLRLDHARILAAAASAFGRGAAPCSS